jgi:hypothetical protein
MNTTAKNTLIRALAVAAISIAAMSSANAAVIFRSRLVVTTPVAVVAPVVVAAPVAVAPVYVPTCRFVSVPVMNAYTGLIYMVTRQVCN